MPGPPPKDPRKRARGARGETPRVLAFERAKLPELPPDDLLDEGEEWHPATLRWWATWRDSPLAVDFTAVDVTNFEECAVLHTTFMRTRRQTVAAELRLKMQNYGVDPASRARLRIYLADADEKDGKRKAPAAGDPPASQGRYAGLRIVDEAATA